MKINSDESVVRFEQSEAMFDAARGLKKQVQLIRLPSEDHWLTRGETRRRMLETTADFLRKCNPLD